MAPLRCVTQGKGWAVGGEVYSAEAVSSEFPSLKYIAGAV